MTGPGRALGALLAGTAVLYLWGLGDSGWANAFYAAAAQAGSQSWKAFFFGSSDAANAITVDKPPASLWAMALSMRVFGVNSWSLLVPQALMGVGTVALVWSSVRRWFSPAAALIAGAVMALTPVAALMFRFDNPDAMLVLLLTGAAYAVTRAVEAGSGRWLLLAGALVGFAFLAKMLQAFLVVPAFALVYLVAAPNPVRTRLIHLVGAGAAMVAASAWWLAIVELWPASSRPYIGGSRNNSILELALGYNGLGRLTGNEVGSVTGGANGGRGPGGQGGGMWGRTGLARLFDSETGGQIAWLLPAALILLVAMLWAAGRAPRTDRLRAATLLWGGWLLVTGLTFSLMAGIFHTYYTVALAPAIAALTGIGTARLWQLRPQPQARYTLTAALAVTAGWAYVLLNRTPDWHPWLRPLVLTTALLAAAGLLVPLTRQRIALTAAWLGLAAVLVGPVSYAIATAAQPHTGSVPVAGPARPARTGGPLDAPGAALTATLRRGADSSTWVAAAVDSRTAAAAQLATGEPVLSIGGFKGIDPAPSLPRFQQWVAEGKVRYFIDTGVPAFGGTGRSTAGNEITTWVTENYRATTVDGVTLFALSGPAPGTGTP